MKSVPFLFVAFFCINFSEASTTRVDCKYKNSEAPFAATTGENLSYSWEGSEQGLKGYTQRDNFGGKYELQIVKLNSDSGAVCIYELHYSNENIHARQTNPLIGGDYYTLANSCERNVQLSLYIYKNEGMPESKAQTLTADCTGTVIP